MSWEARFPWTNGPSGWPSASPGRFWLCFGWPGHKIHCPCEAKRPFYVNFELVGQFPWTSGPSGWPSATLGDFGCVLGGQATKSTVCVRPKDIFCINFGSGMESAFPASWFWFKTFFEISKPGTFALLATLQSPVNFFRRAKLLELPHKFCTLPRHFCK